MRNFHRDFHDLNSAYENHIQPHNNDNVIQESVSDDIDGVYRESSKKQLREALSKIAQTHADDSSSLSFEDVCAEMTSFAKENMSVSVIQPALASDAPAHGVAIESDDVDSPCPSGQFWCAEDNMCKVDVSEMTFDEQLDMVKKLEDHGGDSEEDEVEENFEVDSKAIEKGLDNAISITNKYNDKGMLSKLGSSVTKSGMKKVADSTNNYMAAVTTKLDNMTSQMTAKG